MYVVESPSTIPKPTGSKKRNKILSKKRKKNAEYPDSSDNDVLLNWIRTFQIGSDLDSNKDEWVNLYLII